MAVVAQQLNNIPQQFTSTQAVRTNNNKDKSHQKWYQKVGHFFSGLKALFVIRHRINVAYPLLSKQQLIDLKQNIFLKIRISQWAVINHNQALYNDSLKQIKTWLVHDLQTQKTQVTLTHAINQLMVINIAAQSHVLSKTIAALNQYIQQINILNSRQHVTPKKVRPREDKSPAKPVKPKLDKSNAGMEI